MQEKQLKLPFLTELPKGANLRELENKYKTDDLTTSEARINLEQHYTDLITPTHQFNRRLVSYQANKRTRLHRWIKYKEGFSAKLVDYLLDEFQIGQGQHILDPFAGSGTTLLVAQAHGIHATGIELLPIAHLAWQTKSQYAQYDLDVLEQIYDWIATTPPGKSDIPFSHIPITESAFPEDEERHLMWYQQHLKMISDDPAIQTLLRAILMSVLEDISYTRKDGQYLRWDSRSNKAQQRDSQRIAKGKQSYKTFHKSKILPVKTALLETLQQILDDLRVLQKQHIPFSEQQMILNTALDALPAMPPHQFDAVITSPPYCNRYDYTRTYALELTFLGLNHKDVVQMRQEQISCTVENRSKRERLRDYYTQIGHSNHYWEIIKTIDNHVVLQEVFTAIQRRADNGDLNNKGVVQMIRGYFTELAFITYELFHTCKSGAQVAIVNDNVRYGGEIIPVDLLMLDIATEFGFEPQKIYVLPQRKGNSSQQMGRFGREALRKSIIIWRKPNI